MQATMTSEGQLTLPKASREHLALRPGDWVEFLLEDDVCVRMMPVMASVRALRGILPKPRTPVSLDAMDRAITDAAGERFLRG